MRPFHYQLLTVTCAISLLAMSGCTIKGTVKQITDTTSNVTGTTSGHAWWNEDGILLPGQKAIAFAAYNEANMEQDLARGQGEYVTSMATLLGVPADQQPAFQAKAQGSFDTLNALNHEARLQQLQALARE
ncbi:MAG: DUF3015 domain-containing protein [Nitrospira sp.]|nr:DUF3015 domain-containing protein [Nitrospira sp.]